MKHLKSVQRAAIWAVLIVANAVGQAQETVKSERLEEIVVTAQKRPEPLQLTPVSVTALTAEALSNMQIKTMEGLQHEVPNLYMEQALAGTTTPKMFLRGVGVDNQVFSFDSPIGLYVDGVYIARVTGALTDLNDVERVEFLRGPQGTLYGRNSSVGALSIIHRQPTLDESRAEVSVGLGSREAIDVQFAASAALVPGKVGFSISGSRRERGGYMTNLTTGDHVMDENITSIRAALLFQPMETLGITLRGDLMNDHSLPTQASNYRLNADNDIFTFETSPSSKLINRVEPRGGSATLNWSPGGFDLTSVTAYRRLLYRNSGDVDGRADVRSFEVDRQDLNQNQFTQEVFLTGDHVGRARLAWTAGAFYLKEDNEFHWALRIFAAPPTQVFFQKTTSAAAYAQGTLPLTERLSVTAGLRYTSEKKSLDAIQYLPSDTVPTQEITRNPNFAFADSIKANRTNWRAAIDYKLADRTMLYANAATGFRSGGFNGSARDVAGITSGQFGPESSFMTEAGVKTDLLDRRLRINALYYYAKYTDLQQAIVNPDGSIVAGNVKADVKGVEAEITALPIDSLRLSASVGTADDSIKKSPREIKDTPSLQYRLSALYTVKVGGSGSSMSVGADMAYSGKYFNDTNNAAGTLVDPYYMWNGYLSYELPDDHWKFTLAGFNLGDESYPNHTFDIANGFISSVQFPIPPRRYMFTAAFKY